MLLWRDIFNILGIHTSQNKNYNRTSPIFVLQLLVKMAEDAQYS